MSKRTRFLVKYFIILTIMTTSAVSSDRASVPSNYNFVADLRQIGVPDQIKPEPSQSRPRSSSLSSSSTAVSTLLPVFPFILSSYSLSSSSSLQSFASTSSSSSSPFPSASFSSSSSSPSLDALQPDSSPVLQPDLYYYILEEGGVGAVVGDVGKYCDDGSAFSEQALNQQVSSLFSGRRFSLMTHVDVFDINERTGVITTRQNLDREQLCQSGSSTQRASTSGLTRRHRHHNHQCLLRLHIVVTLTTGAAVTQEQTIFRMIQVGVEILDVNDNTPTFDLEVIEFSVSEAAEVGAVITVGGATDRDSPANGIERFFIERAVSFDSFQNNTSNGTSSSSVRFPIVKKEIKVDDVLENYEDGRTGKSSVHVESEDKERSLGEGGEMDDKGEGYKEDEEKGADEDDEAGDLSEFLLNIENRVDGGGADVRLVLRRGLDRERVDRYMITVVAVDSGMPPRTGTLTIQLTVLDANDNSPEFMTVSQEINMNENEAIGAILANVHAVDPDIGRNGQVKYIFAQNTIQEYGRLFGITHRTGRIYLKSQLDYEADDPVYILSVLAVDRGQEPMTSQASVTLYLNDVNDNAPIIRYNARSVFPTKYDEEHYSLRKYQVDPEKFEMSAGRLSVADLSAGELSAVNFHTVAKTVVSWTEIQEAKPSNSFSQAVNIDAKSYSTDPEAAESQRTVKFTDNMDEAELSGMFSNIKFGSDLLVVELPENAELGAVVLYVHVSDADSGDNSEFFCFLGNEQELNSKGVGFILSRIGYYPGEYRLTTATVIDSSLVQNSQCLVVITCRDYGVPPLFSSLNLTLRLSDRSNHAPQFDSDHVYITLAENNVIGCHVMNVTATDSDEGMEGRITYRLEESVGVAGGEVEKRGGRVMRGGKEGSFENEKIWQLLDVNSNTGEITASVSFDYEVIQFVKFLVIAIDGGSTAPLSSSLHVTLTLVDVDDEDPTFTEDNFIFNITENSPVGADIGHVIAHDRDSAPHNLFYFAFDKNYAEASRNFQLDHITGRLSTRVILDREMVPVYRFVVLACSFSGGLGETKEETGLNQECRGRRSSSTRGSAGVDRGGDRIGTIEEDVGEDAVRREVEGGGGGGGRRDRGGKGGVRAEDGIGIEIDGGDGKVIGPTAVIPLVTNGRPASAMVTVRILDVNDNRPKFIFPTDNNNTVNVALDIGLEQVGTYDRPGSHSEPRKGSLRVPLVVARVVAHDVDEGANADISYRLGGGNGSGFFEIHSRTGVITATSKAWNFEASLSARDDKNNRLSPVSDRNAQAVNYSLRILATDHGYPPLQTAAILNIHVMTSFAELSINNDADWLMRMNAVIGSWYSEPLIVLLLLVIFTVICAVVGVSWLSCRLRDMKGEDCVG